MSAKAPKKKNRRGDVSQVAASIVAEATADEPEAAEVAAEDEPADGKNPAAVALGRLGGKKGGKARAQKLSKEQRSAIAKKAAAARWKKEDEED